MYSLMWDSGNVGGLKSSIGPINVLKYKYLHDESTTMTESEMDLDTSSYLHDLGGDFT